MGHHVFRADLSRYSRYISAGLLLASSLSVLAQAPVTPHLPDGVVGVIDRLYPGFVEVLESHDSFALTRLAETLTASGSPEAVPVLAWILEDLATGKVYIIRPGTLCARQTRPASTQDDITDA